MPGPKQITDRDLRFLAALLKHNKLDMKPDWETLAAELNITENSAKSYNSQIKKKLFAYLDGPPPSSSSGVRKRSAPTISKGCGTGAGRSAARGRSSRGRRSQQSSTSGKASRSSKNEAAIILDDDQDIDDMDDRKQKGEDPFADPEPDRTTETWPAEVLDDDDHDEAKIPHVESAQTEPTDIPPDGLQKDDHEDEQVETSNASKDNNAKGLPTGIETPENQANDHETEDAELLAHYDQDIVDWVARNAGIW